MGIEINGKKYEFNPDIRLGILELMENVSKLNIKQFRMIFKEILIPNPTPKELFNIKTSHIEKIFSGFTESIQREVVRTKKKLSN